MSNENDDATQLGSIGRHMSKPQQPGNPQARPAFQATSLPTHPQEQDGDEEARYSARITQLLPGRRGLRFQWRSPCRRNRRNPLQHNSRYHNRNRLP